MAIWRPDLHGRTGPKYLQIVEAMAEDIAAGRLAPGTRLPPHRELAYQLGMSANTTSRAYAEAVKRALLRGEVGRGTFVRSVDPSGPGAEPQDLRRARTGPIDLSRNLPLAGFSEPPIRAVLAEISNSAALPALLDYQSDDDLQRHSEAGRLWLGFCGVETRADDVIATVGGQHGLLSTLMALLRRGDLLLTETLTYMPVQAMAERLGLHTATVQMDGGGALPDAFEGLCRRSKPKAFYLTPTLHAPTTMTLSDSRREEIAEIAQRHGVMLIEDDVFGPLKPDRPPPLAVRAPDHVVYVTSLSKSVAPGLRAGFLGVPGHLVPALRHAVNLSVWMTPPLTLEAATRLIGDGTAQELAVKQRDAAARRQALARSVLSTVDLVADEHGLHIWVPLPAGMRADLFRAQCARQGVLVSEARSFAVHAKDAPEAIRVCLSHEPDEARPEEGLQKMAHLFRDSANSYALEI